MPFCFLSLVPRRAASRAWSWACASVLLFAGLLALAPARGQAQDWRFADNSSAGLAPLPDDEPRAVVQVYAARTVRWRGYFAVHSWIATKPENGTRWTTYHVLGWRLFRGGAGAVAVEEGVPDRRWYGAEPMLIDEVRGPRAAAAIPKIVAAVESYPYPDFYRAWPGPNSNTFISHILRNVPELGVELPPLAIGKDWLAITRPVAFTESGTGVQFSLLGVLGLTVGLAEGVEINLLGLTFGVDFARPALKLPLVGRLGMKDSPVFSE
jgi:hypothetical protein